jgi:hypothetical protein
MTDRLIFNHHSLPFAHRDNAEAAVPDFLKTCIEARNEGLKTILVDQVIDSSWFRLELAPAYAWQDWYDQHTYGESRDVVRAFRSIATQTPFFNSEDMSEGADLFEVSLDGNCNFFAVSAAEWHHAPLVSFNTGAPWNTSPLQVTVNQLNPITEKMESWASEILNFYTHSVFLQYLPELRVQRNASLSSGKEIVACLNELFPKIVLCGKATQQLNNWSGSTTIINQVKESFSALNQYAVMWSKNEVCEYRPETLREMGLSFKVSGESQTVKNTPKLRREREFWLPSGTQEFFEQHIKLSAGYRLHFFPDIESKQIMVGYIGPHLRLK